MNFYVVFEGESVGVYDSCLNCRKLVFSDNNNYQIYKDVDEAVNAWEIYCKFHGFGDTFFQAGLLQPEHGLRKLSLTNTNQVELSGSEIPPQSTIYYNMMKDPELYNWEGLCKCGIIFE
jgi:hypothetical protein